MFVIIWMILIHILKAAQDPDWLEEGVLEGFVAEEIAEEGHLLNILVLVTLSNFHSAVLSVRSTAALWQAWGGSAWRRCRRKSRWGSWRRRWTPGRGGWSWWSTRSSQSRQLMRPHCNINVVLAFWCVMSRKVLTSQCSHYRGTHSSWWWPWGCCRRERRQQHRLGSRQGSSPSSSNLLTSFAIAWKF